MRIINSQRKLIYRANSREANPKTKTLKSEVKAKSKKKLKIKQKRVSR